MAISRVGTPTATGSSTTSTAVTTSLPTGIQAGDVLILNIINGNNQAITSAPSGWTFVDFSQDSTATTATRIDTYWKVAGSSETAPTATLAATARWTAHIAAYRGVDTAAPFIFEDGKENSSSDTNLVSSLVTNGVSADAWSTVFAGVRGVDGTWTGYSFPAGLTELVDYDPGGTSTGRVVSAVGDSDGVLGDTADRQYTLALSVATGNGVTWTGILRPAAAAVPPEAPTGVQVTPSDTTADVTWTASDGATSYDVEWAVTSTAVETTAATSWAVRAVVAKTAATAWGVYTTVTTTASTGWAVASESGLSTVSQTIGTTWNVGGPVTRTVVTSWAVLSESTAYVRVAGVNRPILAVRRDGINYTFTIRRV